MGDLVTQDMEKAAFALVFTSKINLQESQVPKTRGKAWNKEDATLVEEDQVRKHLSKVDIHKSMCPDGHPQVLSKLGDVIARPLLIIFDLSWWPREVPKDWRKVNVMLTFKNGKEESPGIYRSVILT